MYGASPAPTPAPTPAFKHHTSILRVTCRAQSERSHPGSSFGECPLSKWVGSSEVQPGARILCQGSNPLCLGFTLRVCHLATFPRGPTISPRHFQARAQVPNTQGAMTSGPLPVWGHLSSLLGFRSQMLALLSPPTWDTSLTFLGFSQRTGRRAVFQQLLLSTPPLRKVSELGDTKGTLKGDRLSYPTEEENQGSKAMGTRSRSHGRRREEPALGPALRVPKLVLSIIESCGRPKSPSPISQVALAEPHHFSQPQSW